VLIIDGAAADQDVVAGAAGKNIGVVAADEDIAAVASEEVIVSFRADQDVVSAAALDGVVPRAAVENRVELDSGGDLDGIFAVASEDEDARDVGLGDQLNGAADIDADEPALRRD